MQLSTIKDCTEIMEIDDLDEVAGNEAQLQVNTITEARVVGVFLSNTSQCAKSATEKCLAKKSLALVTDVACSNVWMSVIQKWMQR